MRKKLHTLIFILILSVLLGIGSNAQAFNFGDIGSFYKTSGETAGFNSATNAAAFIAYIINAFLGLAGAIFVALVVYGGFLWMTSRGADDKIKKAKEVITYSIIGIFIIASAYAITSLIAGAAFSGGSGDDQTTPNAQTCRGQGGVCLTAYQCAAQNGTYYGAPDAPKPLDCNTEVCCLGSTSAPSVQTGRCAECTGTCGPSDCEGGTYGNCQWSYSNFTCYSAPQ